MTDFYQMFVGRPRPGQRARPRRREFVDDVGSVAGAMVGDAGRAHEFVDMLDRVAPPSHPVGPGGVVGDDEPATPERAAQHAADLERHSQWGSDAGALARRARYRPRLVRDEPATSFAVGPGGVVDPDPIERAALATGVSTSYLRALVGHESGGDDKARPGTSSAFGNAQFIESTWVRVMRQYGGPYGLDEFGALTDDELLELRGDPTWGALMAAEYGRENARDLQRALNRPIRENELYLGHFLGSGEAVNLIRAAQEDARSAGRVRRGVDVASPAAVEANPQVFFEGGRYEWRQHPRTGRRFQHYLGGGRARTAAEVVARQSRAFSRDVFQPQERAHEVQAREAAQREAIEAQRTARTREAAAAAEERSQERWQMREPNRADILMRAIWGLRPTDP